VPSCLGPEPTAFFYGYVDYALDCASGVFENSIVLYHACDAFIHDPLLSSAPGSYHPTESFAIVGPDFPGNNFVPMVSAPPAGPLLGDAMRSTASPVPFACMAEQLIVSGGLQPIASACMCPLSFSLPPLQTASRLAGAGTCGGSFASLNVWPIVPWYEMVSTSLGRWTSTTQYPGPEIATVAEGLFFHTDTCDPTGVLLQSLDVFYGAITEQGFGVVPTPILPPSQTFIDMASNYSAPFPGNVPLPLVGGVGPTDHLLYPQVL
jgi:hypothetical protein